MADKIPLKARYIGSDATALGEFESGDTTPIAHGGTGATTTAEARDNLGLGNVDNTSDADKNSATVTLTNKTLTSPVISGGTIDNAAIGGTTPASGAFTTLSASGTVSGSGFSTYLASPPAIGGTTPAAGNFTTLGATGNVTLGDANTDTLTINGTAISCPNNLNFDSNTLFIDATNGLIGIRTSSPIYGLDVNSHINVSSSFAYKLGTASIISLSGGTVSIGDSGGNLAVKATGILQLFNAGAETARITSKGLLVGYTSDGALSGTGNAIFSGKVGIGTSSPGAKLQVNLVATANLASATITKVSDFVAASRAGFSGIANNNDGIFFGMGVGNGIPAGFGFFREASGWNTALAFYTNNITSGPDSTSAMQEKMRIDSSGNVGIGTSSPDSTAKLHTSTTSTTNRTITQSTSAAGYVGYRATNGSGYWEMQIDGASQGLRWLDDGTERLRIDSSGNTIPGADNTQDFGSSTKRWNDIFVGGGVYLGGTGAANYLDDYEEGTWTPVPNEGSLSSLNTKYVKVGSIVHITGYLSSFTASSGTGILVSGLPFTPSSSNTSSGSVFFQRINHAHDQLSLYIAGSNNILFWSSNKTGNYTQIPYSALLADNRIFIQMTYTTDA